MIVVGSCRGKAGCCGQAAAGSGAKNAAKHATGDDPCPADRRGAMVAPSAEAMWSDVDVNVAQQRIIRRHLQHHFGEWRSYNHLHPKL